MSLFIFIVAVSNVNTVIGPAIAGNDPTDQTGINNSMELKTSGVGASKSLEQMPFWRRLLLSHIATLAGNKNLVVLPVPAFNVINGGSYAGNKLAMQTDHLSCLRKKEIETLFVVPSEGDEKLREKNGRKRDKHNGACRLLDGEFEETWMKKGNLLLSSLQHPSERPPGSGCGNTGNGGNPCVGSRKVVGRHGDGALPPPLTPSTSIDH
ncbi:hypothetical protein L1987_03867 [Smallanthus sonchifolius]|uniref:Uncharacterized protein n=1 Tax=Smallanthus sonchifolius TaxID=185202 RepID=A0ACB9KBV0_9ASTR|nr:hypothetical protein L1987_03867 [Smallanthus sonchifolius]